MKSIWQPKLTDILPESILRDRQLRAAAEALDFELGRLSADAVQVLHLPRLDVLPERVLDALALQFHVDFYEPESMEIDVKRDLIRRSIYWHRIKGTRAAIEQLCRTVMDDVEIQEWYEYGGEPYYFKITAKGLRFEDQDAGKFWRMIDATKNARSWLDAILFDLTRDPPDAIMNVAQIINDATHISQDLVFNEAMELRFGVKQLLNDASEYVVDLDEPAVECDLNLNAGFIVQLASEEVIPADYDYDETAELFENYIRRRWQEFQSNPVVRHYSDDINIYDNEFDWLDPEFDDPFPPAGDFLKLYFGFNNPRSVRSLTLFLPRDNVSATEINAVGNYTVANQILVNRKGEPATELKSAFLVTREIDWIMPPPMRGNRRPPPKPPA